MMTANITTDEQIKVLARAALDEHLKYHENDLGNPHCRHCCAAPTREILDEMMCFKGTEEELLNYELKHGDCCAVPIARQVLHPS